MFAQYLIFEIILDTFLLLLIFFTIAFLYSSVGHGGASGYIGLMVILGFTPEVMRPTALILNILVASIATVQFYRNGHFKMDKFLPFIVTSIPFAFIGALYTLTDPVYKVILGICLLMAVLRIVGIPRKMSTTEPGKIPLIPALFAGAVIGLISGLIGIGGGIILSPLILVFNWANPKVTAAVSAPFIMLNSIAGISGLLVSGIQLSNDLIFWATAAVVGGLLGSFWGSTKFNFQTLRILLALVLIIASVKLFYS